MKIAVSYHQPPNSIGEEHWSTSYGFAKAMEKKGHTVDIHGIPDPSAVDLTQLIDEASTYDLIFFLWCGPWKTFDDQLELLSSTTSTPIFMEGGGCRNAIIQNRISPETGIYELFEEDVDMCYYSSVQECVDKVRRLLEDEEYRNKLTTNMYEKITKYHMVGNRVDQVLEVYNSMIGA